MTPELNNAFKELDKLLGEEVGEPIGSILQSMLGNMRDIVMMSDEGIKGDDAPTHIDMEINTNRPYSDEGQIVRIRYWPDSGEALFADITRDIDGKVVVHSNMGIPDRNRIVTEVMTAYDEGSYAPSAQSMYLRASYFRAGDLVPPFNHKFLGDLVPPFDPKFPGE